VLQGLFAGGSNSRSSFIVDLLDDTAWPVVMGWFNEDHKRPLNRSSFKNTVLTTGHDLSAH